MPRIDRLGSVRLARYVPCHFYAIFGSAGKLEPVEHNPNFCNKTAGSGNAKPGPDRQISVLPRTSGYGPSIRT